MKDLIQLIIYLYFMHLMFVSPNYMNLTLMTLLTILFVLKYWRLKEKLANTKIRTKNACKKILSKERKYYTDSLTHDLKVPVLAQLRGINLLKEEILGGLNTEQKELINQIGDSCRYTLEMIAMLANIYKFDDINYELNYEKFSMSDLLLSCFEELS